jgi:hypothetical protein
MIEFGNKVTF